MARYSPALNGNSESWKVATEVTKIFLCYKKLQDYGNRTADICLVMQAVRQAFNSLFMRMQQSLWCK